MVIRKYRTSHLSLRDLVLWQKSPSRIPGVVPFDQGAFTKFQVSILIFPRVAETLPGPSGMGLLDHPDKLKPSKHKSVTSAIDPFIERII